MAGPGQAEGRGRDAEDSNLLIDWREGEIHLMRHLLDGDESQNNGNWQWAASTGADPQPYFRVFNPVRRPLLDLGESRSEAIARFGAQRVSG